MAKKTTIAKNNSPKVSTKKSKPTSSKHPTTSSAVPKEKKHRQLKFAEQRNPYRFIWLTIICLLIAAYILISEISYLSFWKIDADIINLPIEWQKNGNVQNSCGQIGAKIADYLIRQLFGYMGLIIPLIAIFVGLSFLKPLRKLLKKHICPLIVLLCYGSLFLGHFFGRDINHFGSGMGGEMGIYIAELIDGYIGYEGTSITLLIIASLLLWACCSREITKLYNLIEKSIYKLKLQSIRRKKLKQEFISEKIEEEPTDTLLDDIPSETVLESEEESPKEHETDTVTVDDDNKITYETASEIELDNGQIGGLCYGGTKVIFLRQDLIANTTIVSPTEENIEPQLEEEFTIKQKEEESLEEVYTPSEEVNNEEEGKTEIIINHNPSDEPDSDSLEEDSTNPGIETTTDNSDSDSNNNITIEKPKEEQAVSDKDVNERTLYDPTAELRRYKKPPIDLLKQYDSNVVVHDEEIIKNKDQIVSTLDTFGIKISGIEATVGPTVTLYEIKPAPGVRISKIQNLEKDIALALAALGIRIIAPIPGKSVIGIEVPNKQRATVSMHSVIKSAKFHDSKAELPIALGKTIQNETLVLDLAKMPHLLVAGATGQGKSVGLNAIITSLLFKKHPAELKFVMVDPKRLELTQYAALANHFMARMEGTEDIILTDHQKVIYTLNSVCKEMDNRYKLLEDAGVKSLKEYNDKFIHRKLNPNRGHMFLPYIIVIIDEFCDLIMTAGREIETPIARIAQLARAAGIHMIIATQRPSANVITGTIRSNFPARMAFKVSTQIDSRVILDKTGADQLIGRGDMLISHGGELDRVQCAFIDTPEIEAITKYIGDQQGYPSAYMLPEYEPESESKDSKSAGMIGSSDSYDPLIVEIARYVVDNQVGSASTIQRHFNVGFNRAGRIVDQLHTLGIVGPQQGSKPRQVLISDPVFLEHILEKIS